jgi:HAD superfamily hydrolase (TIGR01509 family)
MTINYQQKKISAVIFDMDRLLVETSAIWEQPAKSLMSSINLQWTPEISRHYRGMDAKGVVETIFKLFKPDVSIEKCHALYRSTLLKAFEEQAIQPLPGADAILRYLHKKVPLALASGSPPEGIERVLNSFNWSEYFDVVISSEKVGTGRGKPFPDVFLEAARQLVIPASKCLVLEDALEGVNAALSASMHCIAVPSADGDKIQKLGVETFHSLELLHKKFNTNRGKITIENNSRELVAVC